MFEHIFTQKEFDEIFQNGEGLAIYFLHKKLDEAGIPNIYKVIEPTENDPTFGGQIFYGGVYPDPDYKGDVIQLFTKNFITGKIRGVSYGSEDNLLEAMGFGITRELYGDDVSGYMTVDDAFEMIQNFIEEKKGN